MEARQPVVFVIFVLSDWVECNAANTALEHWGGLIQGLGLEL